MCADQKVIVRLSSETVNVLCALVEQDEFRSLSDAVRSVLNDYASERLASGVKPSSKIGDDAMSIEDLTIDGSFLDSAVRTAARDFVRERINLEERQWGM